jgi:hypothetical protein
VLIGCATPAPSPTALPPPTPPKLVCGRVDPADCAAIEALLIQQVPAAAHATTIAMDDSCQQGEACPIGLHVLVAILIPKDPAVDYATWPPTYFAVNNEPTASDSPTELVAWTRPLPGAFIDLLNSVGFGLPTPTPSPTPGPVADAVGNIRFVRPATWFDQRPTHPTSPGVLLWITNQSIPAACGPLPPGFPMGCRYGVSLPDGSVQITFGSGATLVETAATPLPIRQVTDAACVASGGHGVSTRLEVFYIDACLRGPTAEAEFAAFYASLRIDH